MSAHRVDIQIEYTGVTGASPECVANCPKHDDRKQRSWRHLDTMQSATYLHCSMPRVHCKEHGARTVNVPWAAKNSRFTLLFEGFAARVLQAAHGIEEARKRLGLNWHQVNAIKTRAVQCHSFIDNLVSKSNGRFIEVWEGESLKYFFTNVRNPLGHGPGRKSIPELSD